MTIIEFSNQFDILYNNITSNQAPGLNEYEKSVFLTKAQDEIVKNYFEASSLGNTVKKGFDDTILRQMDFSSLMTTREYQDGIIGESTLDPRAIVYDIPENDNVYIVINESLHLMDDNGVVKGVRQVVPLSYLEYSRLMLKPFKQPVKNQAWRLITSGKSRELNKTDANSTIKTRVEIITTNADLNHYTGNMVIDLPEKNIDTSVDDLIKDINISINEPIVTNIRYVIRYVRKPRPIILTDLDDIYGESLSINGHTKSSSCELSDIVQEAVLQRAVELAKISYEGNANDTQLMMEAGKRSE